MTKSRSKLRGFATAALSVLICLTMALTGCGKKETPGDDPGGSGGGETGNALVYGNASLSLDPASTYAGGTHEIKIAERPGEYLVRGGETEYKIVYPAAASVLENTAVSELLTFFEGATGIVLPAIPDSQAVWADNAKYISVGATSLLSAAGVEADEAVLGQTGLRVVTAGDSVFLTGAHEYGTLNAAYEFLGYLFDWEAYSDNVTTYRTGVTEVPLFDFDVTEVPDFEFNVASHQYIRENEDLKNRFRMIQLQDQAFGYTDNIYHNSLEWLPASTYKGSHPDWYSTYTGSSANLCYFARGNKAEYELMVAEVVSLMKQRIKVNPGKRYISFGIQDTQTLCNCTECQKRTAQYNGSQAAGVVLFLNDVYDDLAVWFADETETGGAAYACGQKILFFAYHATNAPPVSYNEASGKYEPLPIDADDPDAGVFSCENIVPWFAETNGDYLYSLTENDAVNGEIEENLKGWSAISDEILFWTYGTNFNEYLTPYYSFEGFVDTYRFAAETGVKTLYAQHQTNNANSTGWERLKGYLNYKLAWNVNYDVNQLIERFFANYFGPAAAEMRDMFEEYRLVGHLQRESGYAVRRSIFHSPMKAEYWPRNSLVDWQANLAAALDAIEPLAQKDAELYDAYYLNIVTERIWVDYLLIGVYASSLSTQSIADYRARIKSDCTLAGIDKYKETNGDISGLWAQWGL